MIAIVKWNYIELSQVNLLTDLLFGNVKTDINIIL